MWKNRNKLFLSLFMALIITILAACSGEETAQSEDSDNGDQVVIRMANLVEKDNFQNQGYMKFKEYIEEKSDGKVKVEIHNGGTIASSDEQIVEQLNSGSLELSTSSAYGVANTTNIKGFNLFDMPFLFEGRDELYSLTDGEYGDKLAEEVSETQNVKVLGFIDMGFYSIMNGQTAIESPGDLQGLTIRSSAAALHLETLKAFGANPTPMDYSEVYTGLQQGTVDGLSTTTPLIYGDRFFEVNKNITLTNHVPLTHVVMVNKDFYNGLTDDVRQLVDEAAEEFIMTARELTKEAEQEAIQGLADEGVEVIELTAEQKEEFQKEAEKVHENNIDEVGEENYNRALEQLGK
ncbi:TRAP transporter substrate-binding protein [Virgibacillus ainsalahensis]